MFAVCNGEDAKMLALLGYRCVGMSGCSTGEVRPPSQGGGKDKLSADEKLGTDTELLGAFDSKAAAKLLKSLRDCRTSLSTMTEKLGSAQEELTEALA